VAVGTIAEFCVACTGLKVGDGSANIVGGTNIAKCTGATVAATPSASSITCKTNYVVVLNTAGATGQ